MQKHPGAAMPKIFSDSNPYQLKVVSASQDAKKNKAVDRRKPRLLNVRIRKYYKIIHLHYLAVNFFSLVNGRINLSRQHGYLVYVYKIVCINLRAIHQLCKIILYYPFMSHQHPAACEK